MVNLDKANQIAGDLEDELRASRRDLEEWSGQPVTGLSAPGGRAGRREYLAARAAGYELLLNSVPGPNRRPPAQIFRRLRDDVRELG